MCERELFGHGLDTVDGIAKHRAADQTLAIPGDVLACDAHAGVLTVKRVEVSQM